MAISFSNLVENERTFAVEINGEDLNVTYKPKTLSAAFMNRMAEEVDEDDSEGFAKMFCKVITKWDLTGPIEDEFGDELVAAGETIPLDPRVVAYIPTAYMRFILEQVAEDSAPKSRKRSGSSRR